MLDRLFKPRAIALIGVSGDPLSIGRQVLRNLTSHGYPGAVHLVNSRLATIEGIPVYSSILDVPGEVDLADIAVRASAVPEVLEDCGRKGVKFAIIHAAGFKEAGEAGRELEDRIVRIARVGGIRLCGPNSQGVQCSEPSFPVYANFTFVPMPPGRVSVLAQSGGVGETLKLHLFRAGLGLRIYAGYGNEADLGLSEFLDYVAADPGTRAVMVHVERLRDPARVLESAARVAARKPLLALKSGRTPEGEKAAASHTGVLAAREDLAEAVLDKAGALLFRSQEEMIAAAVGFSEQPCPKGRRVAVLTNTGGPAVIAIDECVEAGLAPPAIGPGARKALERVLPPAASLAHPVDVLATTGAGPFGEAMDVLLADPGVDALLLVFVTPAFVDSPAVARRLAVAATGSAKPVVAQVITLDPGGEVIRTLRAGGMPVFEFAETAARVLAALADYPARAALAAAARSVPAPVRLPGLRDVLDRRRGDGFLSVFDAARLLGLFGIPLAEPIPIDGRDGLEAAAARAGFPLVLKADSPKIVHKTEAGAVALGLNSPRELKAAFDRLSAVVGDDPEARLYVQSQASGGREAICGLKANPGLPPSLMVGLGGVWVEAMAEVRFRLGPLSTQEAVNMIRSIRGLPVLAGGRGRGPADLPALARILVRLSEMGMAVPEIREADLNPILVFDEGRGALALDVRIRLGA